MADTWSWGLRDGSGNPLRGTLNASERRLLYARNRAGEARLRLGLADTSTTALLEALAAGMPQLVVSRNNTVVFAGHWMPMEGGHDKDSSGWVNLIFKDAFGAQLEYRYATNSYAAEDAGLIAEDLLTTSDDEFGSATNIQSAWTVEPTKLRDRNYNDKQIAEAIIELAEVQGGFDWYPTYLDPAEHTGRTMRMNIAARQGSDRPGARFEFGPGTLGNCTGYTFTVGLPVNVVRATGDGIASLQFDEDSIDRYGQFDIPLAANDISEQATLDDKALDALRPDPVLVTGFVGDPAMCPQPWDDFWIADTIRANIDDDSIQQQLEPRVQTVEIALDDSDNISELLVGIDPASQAGSYLPPANSTRRYVQQQRDLLRRLSALER